MISINTKHYCCCNIHSIIIKSLLFFLSLFCESSSVVLFLDNYEWSAFLTRCKTKFFIWKKSLIITITLEIEPYALNMSKMRAWFIPSKLELTPFETWNNREEENPNINKKAASTYYRRLKCMGNRSSIEAVASPTETHGTTFTKQGRETKQ